MDISYLAPFAHRMAGEAPTRAVILRRGVPALKLSRGDVVVYAARPAQPDGKTWLVIAVPNEANNGSFYYVFGQASLEGENLKLVLLSWPARRVRVMGPILFTIRKEQQDEQ